MSFILAILCFYYGSNNIIAAFQVSLSDFEVINWLLLLTGVGLVVFGFACTYLAIQDNKQKQAQKDMQTANAQNLTVDEDVEYETDLFNYDLSSSEDDDFEETFEED